MNICHLTTVHKRYDSRIFWRMCSTLVKNGFIVNLVVADGKGDEINNGVYIWDIGKPKDRIDRILNFGKKILKKALELDCRVYHFHDPELIPVALSLKKNKKKVIYDVHEDYPIQFLYKYYLNYLYLNKIMAFFFDIYEKVSSSKFDFVITATDFIKKKFESKVSNIVSIFNYPLLEEFENFINWEERKNFIIYSGLISKYRGFSQILQVAKCLKLDLILAGEFENTKLKQEFKNTDLSNIKYLGFLDRENLRRELISSKIGLSILWPTEQYLYSLPSKIFEYMGFGVIPVISNFKFWKEFFSNIEGIFFVDPFDDNSICEIIKYILNNQDLMKKYSLDLRNIIFSKYNWESEAKKLVNVYKSLI